MSGVASRKRVGSGPRGRPIQPGQVLNPKGHNPYTYRRDFETTIDRLLPGVATEAEIEAAGIPDPVRAAITAETTRAEVIARVIVFSGAMAGHEKHLQSLLKRLWPVTSQHELSGQADEVPSEPEADLLSEAVKYLSTEDLERPVEINEKLLKIAEELRLGLRGKASDDCDAPCGQRADHGRQRRRRDAGLAPEGGGRAERSPGGTASVRAVVSRGGVYRAGIASRPLPRSGRWERTSPR